MSKFTSQFSKIKDVLESAAFLVTKGNSEKEVHSKIIQSLVHISQIESELSEIFNKKDFIRADTSDPKVIASLVSEQMNNKTILDNSSEIIASEVKKVKRRVPRWFKNPSQYNSTILNAFLELSEHNDKVTTQMLRSKCHTLSDFDGNYNQMKNFGEKNHGKVFDERDGVISLWEPVKDLILQLYSNQKNNKSLQGTSGNGNFSKFSSVGKVSGKSKLSAVNPACPELNRSAPERKEI